MSWKLKRTAQCSKCPWRKDTNPRDIPRGYCETKHRALGATIARPADVSSLLAPALRVMACHDEHEAHCVGWLHHQRGVGNNLALRMQLSRCDNAGQLRVIGEQHERFEDTLPKND